MFEDNPRINSGVAIIFPDKLNCFNSFIDYLTGSFLKSNSRYIKSSHKKILQTVDSTCDNKKGRQKIADLFKEFEKLNYFR